MPVIKEIGNNFPARRQNERWAMISIDDTSELPGSSSFVLAHERDRPRRAYLQRVLHISCLTRLLFRGK